MPGKGLVMAFRSCVTLSKDIRLTWLRYSITMTFNLWHETWVVGEHRSSREFPGNLSSPRLRFRRSPGEPDKQTEGGNILKDQSLPANIDEYIAGFSPDVRSILEKIRSTIREAAPQAEEKISYRMPAFARNCILVYFAAFKKHIGMYPPVQGDEKLSKQLAPYRGEKGNLKFPLDEPIPYDLIRKVVRLRVKEHLKEAKAKRRQK